MKCVHSLLCLDWGKNITNGDNILDLKYCQVSGGGDGDRDSGDQFCFQILILNQLSDQKGNLLSLTLILEFAEETYLI